MDRQAIFNKVADHLRHQKGRSFQSDSCLYFGDGKRCAIGALLPDHYEHVISDWLGDVAELLETWPELFEVLDIPTNRPIEEISSIDGAAVVAVDETDIDFLLDLQKIHDEEHHWYGDSIRPDALIGFAFNYKLEFEGEVPSIRPHI